MTRQELDEKLVDYLFDELSEAEMSRFEAAVVGYPELEAEVAAHRRTLEIASGLPEPELSPSVMSAVMAEARAAVTPMEPQPSWFETLMAALMQPATVTVALLFVVGGASVFVVSQQSAPDGAVAVAESAPAARTPAPLSGPAEVAVAAAAKADRAPEPKAMEEAVRPAGASDPVEVAALDKERALKSREAKLKPVSKSVARLVELDGGALRGGKASSSKGKAKKAKRAPKKVAEAKPMQVASAPKKELQSKAKAMKMKRLPPKGQLLGRRLSDAPAAGLGQSPVDAGATAEVTEHTRIDPKTGYVTRGRTPAPEKVAKSSAKSDASDQATGKRLVREFDRWLKRGETAKAAKVLERLAKVPGFDETAKRKRVELRRRTKRSKAKAKSKKGGGSKALTY